MNEAYPVQVFMICEATRGGVSLFVQYRVADRTVDLPTPMGLLPLTPGLVRMVTILVMVTFIFGFNGDRADMVA